MRERLTVLLSALVPEFCGEPFGVDPEEQEIGSTAEERVRRQMRLVRSTHVDEPSSSNRAGTSAVLACAVSQSVVLAIWTIRFCTPGSLESSRPAAAVRRRSAARARSRTRDTARPTPAAGG